MWIPTPGKKRRCCDLWLLSQQGSTGMDYITYVFGFTFTTTLTVTRATWEGHLFHSKWYYILTVQIMRITSNNCFHDLSSTFRLFPCLLCLSDQSQVVNRHTQPGNKGQDQPKHRLNGEKISNSPVSHNSGLLGFRVSPGPRVF